jgi:hypothetical protein
MRKHVLAVAMGVVLGMTRQMIAAPCASTPAAAMLAAAQSAPVSNLLPETDGYRVEEVRWDPFLRRQWAVIQRCGHAGQPSFMVRTELEAQSSSKKFLALRHDVALPVVQAGDLVRLWKRDGSAQIQLIATAEENGALGGRVRVRLAGLPDADGQSGQPRYLAGVVRGPADVEMGQ